MVRRILLVVLLVLLVVLAIAVSRACGPSMVAAAGIVLGGAAAGHGHSHTGHHVGVALHEHASSLGPEHIVGVHPLDRNDYAPLTRTTRGGASAPVAKRLWTEYETWEELHADPGAVAVYFEQRAAVLNNPNLDWGPVLAKVNPLLSENREHIGIINLDPDGKTLRLTSSEASPVEAGTLESETAFASVPGELVAKYAEKPGMFIFHTHPADPRGSPLPSSHDLAAAVFFGATSRFAASVVISRYGVLVYGPDWGAYKALHEAKDWKLALLHLSHDVVAAHESIRSWSPHTISEYIDFYPRHRLLFFYYPTAEMVGDMRRFRYLWNLESPIDHEIITDHSDDIANHRTGNKPREPKKESGVGRSGEVFATPPDNVVLSFD
jgi:hypothetical protein